MLDEIMVSNKLLPLLKPRLHRLIKAAKPYAMVSRNRMQSLHRLQRRTERDGVAGDIVEAGVARGGSAILLASLASRSRLDRQVWLYDAFELIQPPEAEHQIVHHTLFEVFQFDPARVHLCPGWFQDTIPGRPGRPISLLHVDVGGCEAVMCCLDHLFDHVSPGGWIVFDNYGYKGGADVRKAVDQRLAQANMTDDIRRCGSTQAYVQKR